MTTKRSLYLKLKTIGFLLIFCFYNLGISQVITLKDEKGNPIPFCEVTTSTHVVFSDSFGQIKFSNFPTITITDDRFVKGTPIILKSDSTLFLKRKVINLEPIMVHNKIKVQQNQKAVRRYYLLSNEFSSAFLVNDNVQKGKLLELKFKTRGRTAKDSYLKLNLYNQDFDRLNYEPIIVSVREFYKNKSTIDVRDYSIFTHNDSLLISLHLIENNGVNKKKENSKMQFLVQEEDCVVYVKSNKRLEDKFHKTKHWCPWVQLKIKY